MSRGGTRPSLFVAKVVGGFDRGVVRCRLFSDRHGIAATAKIIRDDSVREVACAESPWLSRCGR